MAERLVCVRTDCPLNSVLSTVKLTRKRSGVAIQFQLYIYICFLGIASLSASYETYLSYLQLFLEKGTATSCSTLQWNCIGLSHILHYTRQFFYFFILLAVKCIRSKEDTKGGEETFPTVSADYNICRNPALELIKHFPHLSKLFSR